MASSRSRRTARRGRTNLRVTDHKRVVVRTYSGAVADACGAALLEAGLSECVEGKLVSFDAGIHHWHYRHPRSLSRLELVERLYVAGFEDWTPG